MKCNQIRSMHGMISYTGTEVLYTEYYHTAERMYVRIYIYYAVPKKVKRSHIIDVLLLYSSLYTAVHTIYDLHDTLFIDVLRCSYTYNIYMEKQDDAGVCMIGDEYSSTSYV